MINTDIISVQEYTDILVECKRIELLSEGKEDKGSRKMISELSKHMCAINSLTKEAKSAKSRGHFEKARHDFEKVLAELEVMKKIIKEIESSEFEVYFNIISRIVIAVISGIIGTLGMVGTILSRDNVGAKIYASLGSFASLLTSITLIKKHTEERKKAKEREKAGDSKLGSKDENKYNIIADIEKTEKTINAEIKFLNDAIKIDKQRQNNKNIE